MRSSTSTQLPRRVRHDSLTLLMLTPHLTFPDAPSDTSTFIFLVHIYTFLSIALHRGKLGYLRCITMTSGSSTIDLTTSAALAMVAPSMTL